MLGRLKLHVVELHSLITICCKLLVVKLHSYFVLRQVFQLLFWSFFVMQTKILPITWNIYLFFFKERKKRRSNTATDWLALAALKCFTKSGWVFVPSKAVLILHKHVMDNPTTTLLPPMCPECTSPTMAIFKHVHVGYRCI